MTKATLYTLQGFGTHKREIHFDAIGLVDWAQYQQVPAIRFVEKGKRTKKQMKADTKTPSWFLVDGWNHPDAPSGFEKEIPGTNGMLVVKSISSCFGVEYKVQFEKFCDELKSSVKVLHDWRLQ